MIKRLLGERITLKFMPELEFRYDTTFDVAERIEKILKEVLPPGEEEDE
jgi:ribosome-binding factor A